MNQDPIAFLITLLIFIVVVAVIFLIYRRTIEQAVPGEVRPYVLAILGLLTIFAFLRFVLHVI